MINEDELKEAFLANPNQVITGLIKHHSLKGKYRDILIDLLLEESSSNLMDEYLWLLMLPRRISLVTVDNFCNLACRMCGGSKGKMKWIKPDMLRSILKNCPTTEAITFVAGNSEPMLNPDLPENFKLLNENGILSTFVTNGHYLNRKNITAMIETQQPFSVNISLDAIDSKIYRDIRGADNSKVIKGIYDLEAAKEKAGVSRPMVSLLMVGMEDNISELPKFVQMAADTNALRVHVDHMLGNHTPGDFTLNPAWKDYLLESIELANKLNVNLQLPLDSIQILNKDGQLNRYQRTEQNEVEQSAEEEPEYDDGASCGIQSVSLKDMDKKLETMKTGHCPWLKAIHVNIDGEIRPCCNMPANMGNLYETPLWENQNFIQTRLRHSQGEIERLCMGNSNCIYVQELKNKNIRPKYFRKETILKKIAVLN